MCICANCPAYISFTYYSFISVTLLKQVQATGFNVLMLNVSTVDFQSILN